MIITLGKFDNAANGTLAVHFLAEKVTLSRREKTGRTLVTTYPDSKSGCVYQPFRRAEQKTVETEVSAELVLLLDLPELARTFGLRALQNRTRIAREAGGLVTVEAVKVHKLSEVERVDALDPNTAAV